MLIQVLNIFICKVGIMFCSCFNSNEAFRVSEDILYSLLSAFKWFLYHKQQQKYFTISFETQQQPTCVNKWTENYSDFNHASPEFEIWGNIFSLPFKIIRGTCFQSIQFKIIHKLIPCQKILLDMQLTEYPGYCKDTYIIPFS